MNGLLVSEKGGTSEVKGQGSCVFVISFLGVTVDR